MPKSILVTNMKATKQRFQAKRKKKPQAIIPTKV